MRILASEDGVAPVFRVTNLDSGRAFEGSSPTRPWTDVCLARSTGQRISGPLFFGFSDPICIRMIHGMKGFPSALREHAEAHTLSDLDADWGKGSATKGKGGKAGVGSKGKETASA